MPNWVDTIYHTIYMLPKLRATWLTQFCVITYPKPTYFQSSLYYSHWPNFMVERKL